MTVTYPPATAARQSLEGALPAPVRAGQDTSAKSKGQNVALLSHENQAAV